MAHILVYLFVSSWAWGDWRMGFSLFNLSSLIFSPKFFEEVFVVLAYLYSFCYNEQNFISEFEEWTISVSDSKYYCPVSKIPAYPLSSFTPHPSGIQLPCDPTSPHQFNQGTNHHLDHIFAPGISFWVQESNSNKSPPQASKVIEVKQNPKKPQFSPDSQPALQQAPQTETGIWGKVTFPLPTL